MRVVELFLDRMKRLRIFMHHSTNSTKEIIISAPNIGDCANRCTRNLRSSISVEVKKLALG